MSGLTLFFSNSKDFEMHSKSIPNPKIGCTTAGEIDKKLTKGLVKTVLDDKYFYTELFKIENLETPIMYGLELLEKSKKIKSRYKNLICVVLNDGLSKKEEIIQSTLSAILPEGTPIVGGSSGDDLNFAKTYCCVNDDVFVGVAILLIGTNLNYYIHKENIYKETGKYMVVTKAKGRTILEIDNAPAVTKYAEIVGATNTLDVDKYFHSMPFGTSYEDDIFICSPQKSNPDKSISTYREILPGTILWQLKLDDYINQLKATTDAILSKGEPLITLTFNCILRTLLFEQENTTNIVNNYLNKIEAFGLTCYGEQLNGFHINQTMVTLTFYK